MVDASPVVVGTWMWVKEGGGREQGALLYQVSGGLWVTLSGAGRQNGAEVLG